MFSELETEKRGEGRAFADLQASSVSSTPGSLFNAHSHSVCVPKKTEPSSKAVSHAKLLNDI